MERAVPPTQVPALSLPPPPGFTPPQSPQLSPEGMNSSGSSHQLLQNTFQWGSPENNLSEAGQYLKRLRDSHTLSNL
jgi:hypothetical protein